MLEEAVYGGVLRLAEAAVKRNVKCEPLSKVDFWTFPRLMDFWTFPRSIDFWTCPRLMDFWTCPRLRFCSFDPGKEKTFVDPVDWDFGWDSIDTFFEVNDVLCRFDYNYESVCDADLQLNQIIVSVAPELLSRKRFWVSLRMAWRTRMFSQIDWKQDSHTWLK